MIRRRLALCAVVILVCCAFFSAAAAADSKVTLNTEAFEYAKSLIRDGHVMLDKHRDWSAQRPTIEAQNDFITGSGWNDYGRWHLGIDSSAGKRTKRRYKFPFGDFSKVYRSALIAVKNRAAQNHYDDIRDAAVELLEMIDSRKERSH